MNQTTGKSANSCTKHFQIITRPENKYSPEKTWLGIRWLHDSTKQEHKSTPQKMLTWNLWGRPKET
jgi:hypothetical protein